MQAQPSRALLHDKKGAKGAYGHAHAHAGKNKHAHAHAMKGAYSKHSGHHGAPHSLQPLRRVLVLLLRAEQPVWLGVVISNYLCLSILMFLKKM